MKNNLWAYLLHFWYIPLIFLIFGVLITIYFPKKARIWFHIFFERILLLKRYWIFVSIFSSLSTLGYFLIFRFASTTDKTLFLDVYNEVLTLVFAIFVGYFAFLQVMESRFDKLVEKAEEYTNRGQDEFDKVVKYYEECIKINSNDFSVWSNLMEFYLILKKNEIFEDKLYLFKRTIKSPKDWIVYYYLLATKEILIQHLTDARQAISNLTTFVVEHPSSLRSFTWGFREVKGSDLYISLESGTKTIYENLSKYLLKQLSPEDKVRFESGDYELNPITSTVTS